ncbi:MAG: ABC transporter ATP-binding protein [Alphaproteobacteria bacterium]
MLEVIELVKTYYQGKIPVQAVDGVSLNVEEGEFVIITGPSGSGKSTLLNLIGGLDHPTDGDVRIGGTSIRELSDTELTKMRRKQIGFVFQFFNLLPTMSALENVSLPLILGGLRRHKANERAREILTRVGLGDRVQHRPDELSGGEQQRVAIARALAYNPTLILADEPTGNLDTKSGTQVLEMLRDLAKKDNKSVVLVTHDPRAREYGDRMVRLVDGKVDQILSGEEGTI